MSAKHTQGDWVEHNGDILAGGLVIAGVHGPNRVDLIPERNANRNLISAAPKMLKALQTAAALLTDPDAGEDEANEALAEIEAAIAKAKGEA